MNLDGIEVFVKVIQTGSFTKAAQSLNRPVTSVSDKIAQLEKRLGVTLIHRTTRKLKLTSIGESYYEKCIRAVSEFEEAQQELHLAKNEPQGRLRVTMPFDVGHSTMPDLAKRFLQKYPRVQLELIVTNRMVDLIGEGIDLGIRAGKLNDSTYRVRKYRDAQASVWASPEFIKQFGRPIKPTDLEKLPAVIFARNNDKKIELTRQKEKAKLSLLSHLQADDMETIKQLVMASLGIGFLPDFICAKEQKSGDLIQLLPEWRWNTFPLSFVYPEQKFVSPNVKAFIDLALSQV